MHYTRSFALTTVQVPFNSSDEQRLLGAARRKLNVHKVVVVGDGRAGKTSLLRQLRGEPFNESEESTCGVVLCTVKVGAEKWAATDLVAVGDVAALLVDEFRAQQRVHTSDTGPYRSAPADMPGYPAAPARAHSTPTQPARGTCAPVGSPVRAGPIAITTDLPPLLCVAEGSELSLSVRVAGGTPNEPLQYRWSRNGAVVDGQESSTLQIACAARTAAGEYCVEVSCQSQPTPVKSSMAKVRAVSSLMDKVNTILLEHGENLTDDMPKVVVFDCGGQRIYCAVQRLLVTEPLTVYIIVVSLADDLDDPLRCPEDLRYNMTHRQNLVFWLDTIYCHAKKAKIIVVGSKVDGISEDTRKERMAKVEQCVESTLSCAKDMIAGLTYVSSKTGEGIDELRAQIELLRPQLDGYGREVPVGWFKFFSITQELVNQDQRRVSYAEARAIARQCGIVTDDDVRRMLQLFNDAGLLLWRSKEAIAQELVVLSVDWIVKLMTSASCPRHIQKVLERTKFVLRPHLRELQEKGLLRTEILEPLWPDLTESERSSVLQYMVSFGVCCQLRKPHADSTADCYLLPTLFPNVPDGSTVWDVDDERSADLRIRFVPNEYAAEIRGKLQFPEHTKYFLPDTLFFHVVARLLQSLHTADSQSVERCYADRVVLRSLAARYMLQHLPNENMLVLKVYREGESPRLALDQVSAILDPVVREFGVEYFSEALLSHMGTPGYYKIHSLPAHDVSQLWLGTQRAQLEPSGAAPSLGHIVVGASKPLPEGKRFHFFLSHKQQGADGYAALVKEKLKALGYRCWVDTEQTADRQGMEAGVKGSVCVLLFLFKGTLDRPYCRFELRLARALGVPVIALLEGDHYRDTYVSVPDLQSAFDRGELPADLRHMADKLDFNFCYRRQQHEQAAMISRLCEKLEAAMAPGDWPAFTQLPDTSGKAVEDAYRMLASELDAQPVRPTAAPSLPQSTPDPLQAVRSLPPPAPIRNLGEPADAVPNEECKWAGFISHHQAGASRTVQLLKEWIEKNLKERRHRLTKVWVDKQQRATPDGMNEGVRLSRNFILFLTKEVLTREWCLNEIRNALKHRKNVILVYETNEDCGGVSGTFAKFYGPELKKAFPHTEDYVWLVNRNSYVAFQDRGQHVNVMLCDPQCKNGILDQMEFEEAESAATSLPSSSQSCPQSQGESSRMSLAQRTQQERAQKPLRDWTVGDVSAFFTELKLEAYTTAVAKNEVDGHTLAELVEADGLSDLGLTKLHAIQIKRALKKAANDLAQISCAPVGADDGSGPSKL